MRGEAHAAGGLRGCLHGMYCPVAIACGPTVFECSSYAPTWPSAAPPRCHTSQACLPQTAGRACLILAGCPQCRMNYNMNK